MSYLRGALIEYGTDFLGPIPNIVIFQFNPETLSRDIQIPERPTGSKSRETHQAGEVPVEKISLTAYFSAADQLNNNNPLARLFGIGPQLAALEKMTRPYTKDKSELGDEPDPIGKAISEEDDSATQKIPREKYPPILFIWGLTKVLPVIIKSMAIKEEQFDRNLNPIQAQVSLNLSVITLDSSSDDAVAKGALKYSKLVKDAQAAANLVNTAQQVMDIIPF